MNYIFGIAIVIILCFIAYTLDAIRDLLSANAEQEESTDEEEFERVSKKFGWDKRRK